MNKKGVSEVIATVLIILLTVTAIGILGVVIIPFVQKNLEEGSLCSDTLNKIEIIHDDSCYNSNPLNQRTDVKVKVGNVDIDGIYLVFENPDISESKSFDITSGKTIPEINNNIILTLPQKGGGEKIYTVNKGYKNVRAGAIIKSKRCPNPDEDELFSCLT